MTSMEPAEPATAFLMRLEAQFESACDLGETPMGHKRILMIQAGTFDGPDCRGIIRGGGDWVLGRPDGVAELDIRMTLEATDGALIDTRATGRFSMAPDIRERLAEGDTVDRDAYYFRTAFTFDTAATAYAFLNGIVAIGLGQRTPAGMITDVFAVK